MGCSLTVFLSVLYNRDWFKQHLKTFVDGSVFTMFKCFLFNTQKAHEN